MTSVARDNLFDSFPQFSFNHRKLGGLIGLERGDDVVQFRGIPFAEITARFRQARVLDSLPQRPFDARKSGPYCPQLSFPFPPYWTGAIPADYPPFSPAPQDEFKCLNVNITVPRSILEDSFKEKVPVLLFIHGGAFVGGSQSIQVAGREIYDAVNLVRAGIARGQPLVVVTCNYRVGPLGFLASKELMAFNKGHNEPVGNYGLHDQRQALEWCHRFIDGFGGDPDNITIQGTSAGGSSAHYLSIFPNRKFRRAILASGTLTGIGPMPLDHQQKLYNAYRCRHSRDNKVFDEVSVALLQSIPVDEMVKPVTDDIYHPLIDGEWIPGATMETTCAIYKDSHAPDLMIGASYFEADLTRMILMDDMTTKKPASDAKMHAKITELISSNGMILSPSTFPTVYPSVISAYNITTAIATPSSQMFEWADFMADLAFRIPPLHIAAHHPANVLVYEIRCKNPYPLWSWSFGRANHAVNDLFLFDPAPDLVPEELRRDHDGNVRQIRAAWLDFCYGKLPWKQVRKEGETLGPVHIFENGAMGRDPETLEEAMGEETAGRWRVVLEANVR
ncbi:Alpha/Beta hydrolase protein [Clohesyomyces aquaticus]|uniref:Carboxylic ester hydrolase n=1 Tax=Clohesyomyces aquaticus TaxID=1231657 RepID=A0A1Y1YJT3_9PLEO|nr:Alpha/Beta hydrolase protein [Clohesyomyces aquaticus]